jgi:hypothetical protein
MGSFNTACFASRQIIATGDSCLVMPIIQQSSYEPVSLTYGEAQASLHGVCNSVCYPTRFWKPIGAFFEAKYYDYGRVTLDDTSLNRFKLNEFIREALQYTPVVQQGSNEYHDVAYDLQKFMAEQTPELLKYLTTPRGEPRPEFQPDLFFSQGVSCWNYLWDVAQEHRMFWRNYKGVLRPMNFSIMHRAAFDALVARTNSWVGWDKQPYEMRGYFDRALAGAKAKLEELAPVVTEGTKEQQQRALQHFAFDDFREAMRRVGGSEGMSYPGEGTITRAALDGYLSGQLTDDKLFEMFKPWLEVRYACASLEALNLHFEPIVYASQDYNNEIGESYANFVSEVSKTVSRGRTVHYYGSFKDYSISVTDPAVFKELAEAIKEWDGRMELVYVRPDVERPGCSRLAFQATLALSDLQEMLKAFSTKHSDERVLLDMLPAGYPQ